MRTTRVLLSALLLAGSLGGCASDASDGRAQVIIDSDGAFDDIKAILYLLEQPGFEVIALTVSGTGIAHCPEAAHNISALLERIGAPQIPVACGRTTPLEGNNEAPPVWRNAADTLGGVDLPEPRPLSELDAPALLADAIKSAAADVTLVALGPLTNLAEAVQSDPEILDRVEMMYLMGGAVDVGGNVLYANPDAEFNIWADPAAAAIVFATPVPITLIPLDATNHLPVTPYLYQAVEAHRDYSAVSAFTADYLEASPLFGGLYHWDELAAVAATDESVVSIEERLLTIDGDGVTKDDDAGRPVRVAVAANRAIFEDHFYRVILGTSNPDVPAWEPDAVLAWDGTTCTYDGPDPLPDDFFLRLDNTSDELVAFVTGIYDAGTTVFDFNAALEAGEPGTPSWWKERAAIGAPAGAHDVWPARGGQSITALCFVDPTRVWEIAGPRLPE
jgi:pyrimidine-specific ribonucleoside hydrolase